MSKKKENNILNIAPNYRFFLSIFILSNAVINFEIVLTRISSVVFTYNYAFLVVSLALLGLGCGGIFAHYKFRTKELIGYNKISGILSINSFMFSVSLFLFIILLIKVSIFENLFLYFSLAFIPFFFAGIVLSLSFQCFGKESFKIYFFDLLGAATGALLLIFVIKKFGGVNSILFISILSLISTFLFIKDFDGKPKQFRYISSYSVLSLIFLIIFLLNFFNGFLGEIPIRDSNEKDLYQLLNLPGSKAEIIESRWSYFGRVDLIRSTIDDRVKFLFIDGAAGTPMFKFDGDTKNINKELDFLNTQFSGSLPFLFLDKIKKNSMLIIGPGGGIDVLVGLVSGIKNIYGVEINKDFIDIVKDYKEYNGGIYTNFNNVQIINGEGRSFISSTKNNFDIILLAQPYIKSSRSIEGYSLTENYLFTVEAIRSYLSHLTKDGSLIFVLHNTNEVKHLVTTTIKALEGFNINTTQAMNHIYTVGPEVNPVLVIKKSPFTQKDSEKIYKYILNTGSYSSMSFIPFIENNKVNSNNNDNNNLTSNILNNDLIALSKGDVSLEELIKKTPFDIKPITDNRPFLLKTEKGIPKNIILVLVIAAVVNLILFTLLILKIKANTDNKLVIKLFLLYSLLGLGFMAIEISFFQKLILFIGSPTASLAIVLGSLLFGMGIGSFLSKNIFINQKIKRLIFMNFTIFVVTILLFFSLTLVLNNLLYLGLFLKIIICSFVLILIGFILGIPFPTGISLAKDIGASNSITWMYGINGTMSVLGSVAAVAISTVFGFSMSLIFGACCYLLAAIIFAVGKYNLKKL